jgi:hypothetical protein
VHFSFAVAAAVGLAAAAAPAQAGRTTSHVVRYVAGEGGHGYVTDTATRAVRSATGVTTDGQVTFVVPGRGFWMRLDDAAALPGQSLPIELSYLDARGHRVWWHGCQRTGARHWYGGVLPGSHAAVIVVWDAWPHPWGCTGHATTGTLTLRL